MSLGFGFSLPAYNGYAAAFGAGATLALDFTNGNNTLSPAITFSRTTNATVTGSNGLIQFAPMNLLTFSEQFDNAAWSKASATAAANTTAAPNGTVTADTISLTSNLSTVAQAVSLGAGTYTFSVWVKTLTFTVPGALRILLVVDGGSQILTFTPTAEWTRQTFTVTAATSVTSVQAVRGSVYVGDIAIWGAQLELGSTATTYNPTTVKNLLGFTENFDNAAWTKSNAFVQTNLALQSEAFDTASWSKTRSSITANIAVAPDGAMTGDKLVENTDTGTHLITQVVSLGGSVDSSAYNISVYVKAGERTRIRLRDVQQTTTGSTTFDLITGTVVTGTGTITPAGNDWYRCTIFPLKNNSTSSGIEFALVDSGTTVSYTGDGVSGLFLWGAQLVQGATPGDYKATYAAAAAVGYTDIYGQPFAQKLVENTATDTHYVYQTPSLSAISYTFSVYLKAAERTFARLNCFRGVAFAGFVNLLTGAVSGLTNGATLTAVDVGNGWWRCALTFTVATAGSSDLGVRPSANGTSDVYTGDGTSGIYIFGAQLSDSASVDPYVYQPVAAPASTAYYGPRFDYDPVTLQPKGLLIEEQRTNLLTYSEQFDNAAWVKTNATITTNTAVAPDGTSTGDKLVADTLLAQHRVNFTATAAAGTYAFSVYLKAGEYNFAFIRIGLGGGWVDLVNGSVSGVTGGYTMTATLVANGWYRVVLVGAAALNDVVRVNVIQTNLSTDFAGDGTSGIFLWGAQLEAGAFQTSYIATVASQVTRAADSASMIGNNFARWYTQGQGTLFVDATGMGNSTTARYVAGISDNSTSNFIGIANDRSLVVAGGTGQASFFYTIITTGVLKSALAYKQDDFAVSLNGGAASTDTSGTVPIVNQLSIGDLETGTNRRMNSWIKRIAYYNRRLANTELTALTS
jgi:hypothetical protein